MSSMQKRMAALSGGAAVDVNQIIARSPADGGGTGGNAGVIDREPRVERKVGLG